MIEVTLDKDIYQARFDELEKSRKGGSPDWLARIRRSAMARFRDLGFPGTDQEEWRFTNVAPIARTRFLPGRADASFTAADLDRMTFEAPDALRLVFVNGIHAPLLSSGEAPDGVLVAGIKSVLESDPGALEPFLARHAPYENHPFAALNTALMVDGAFVRIPDGVRLARPIHVVYLSKPGAEPTMSHPRTLVVAGAQSSVTLVESYAGSAGVYLTNAVTEIVAAPNAQVDHYRLQKESIQAFHTGSVEVHLARDANVSTVSISTGGALVRNDVNAVLDGEGAWAAINGLYVVGGDQHVDNHTGIDHAMPHCSSREMYKGVLDGRSRAVFNGRIRVRKDAQKTDSKQTNKNLLLSNEALVNTNPQLEIYADDVRCTHGATIGQLDDDALFYLQARGIPAAQARAMLTWAFANDVVEQIRFEPLKVRLEADLIALLREGRA